MIFYKTKITLRALLKPLVPLMIIVTAFMIIPHNSNVNLVDEIPLNLPPPEALPAWETVTVYFCQNRDCLAVTVNPAKSENTSCPKCGHQTDIIPLPEKEILPPDTLLFRELYTNNANQTVSLIIVVSGESRSSIHKPEICLTGQGLSILKETTHSLELSSDKILKTTLLDVARTHSSQSDRHLFAYWFRSPHLQTGSQVKKNLEMIKERLFNGRISRWAYVSVLVPYSNNREKAVSTLDEFIREIYPLLESSPTPVASDNLQID